MRVLRSKIVSLLAILLFAGYYAGSTLFPHAHIYGGIKIIHSHPYSGNSSTPGHSHSSAEFQLIKIFNSLVLATFLSIALERIYRSIVTPVTSRIVTKINNYHNNCLSLRAPPIVF